MARVEQLADRPLGHARIGNLRVAEGAGLVDVLPGQADVGCGSWAFPCGTPKIAVSRGGDLATILRRIVFVREAAFGRRRDLKRVGLRTVGAPASQTASARSWFEKLRYRSRLFASRCFVTPRNSNAQSDYFQREYNYFQIAPSIYSRNGGRAGPFWRLEMTIMNAQQLIRFQQDQDTEFRQLSQDSIDAATAVSLAAAAEIEWAAVTEMRTTAASSLAEVAARAELLAGFIEHDLFDDGVWADMARRIAIDLRAALPAPLSPAMRGQA